MRRSIYYNMTASITIIVVEAIWVGRDLALWFLLQFVVFAPSTTWIRHTNWCVSDK